MIDEKRLDELLKQTDSFDTVICKDNEAKELIRLARIGLWAEQYAIPDLKKIEPQPAGCESAWYAKEALAKLPKEQR